MAFNPQTYLEVAEYLLSVAAPIDREAALRTAVNRLYYSHFLKLRRYLREQGVRGATNHQTLSFALMSDLTTQEVGHALVELLRLRNVCDYDDSNDLPASLLADARMLSQKIQHAMEPLW